MAIKTTTRRIQPQTRRVQNRAITAGTSIASQATKKNVTPITANVQLSREKSIFANQLRRNIRQKTAVMAATNTSSTISF